MWKRTVTQVQLSYVRAKGTKSPAPSMRHVRLQIPQMPRVWRRRIVPISMPMRNRTISSAENSILSGTT